jgi:hypothetical protein
MTYPLSSPVTAGQPTASDHYNNLRKDAVNLGQSDQDVVNLGMFLKRFATGVKLEYLATNRVRVPYTATNPPTLMINGCMLQATGNVDLQSGLISGPAATWYFFAVRSAGSSTFTLSANTSASESTDQRLIGQAYWNGSLLISVLCYLANTSLPPADYDSGWFACAPNTTYTRSHGLGSFPRLITLYHSADSAGTSEWVPVHVVQNGNQIQSPLSCDSVNIYVQTGSNPDYNATCFSTRRSSLGGYYRIFAWI